MTYVQAKFTGNGYYNKHTLNGEPMVSGTYWVQWPDKTVTKSKVLVRKEPYSYGDMGHTYNAEHQKAYVLVELYGVKLEVPVDKLKFESYVKKD